MTPLHRLVAADDDEMLRLLVETALGIDGRFDVVGMAADGVEALALVEEHDPDVLLLDLEMPNLNGMGVLRALQGRSRPIVVVLSAASAQPVIDAALAAGAVAFLDKVSTADSLPESIAAALDVVPSGGDEVGS